MIDSNALIELIGENNKQKLQNAITDLLISRIESDLNEMCTYLIDFEELLEDVAKDVEKEVKDKIKDRYINMVEKRLDDVLIKAIKERKE